MSGIYHYDLFGTMLRYFPAFDFPNNDTNVVFAYDIDLSPDERTTHKICPYTKITKTTDYIIGAPKTNDALMIFDRKHNTIPNLLGMSLLLPIKYDRNIILDFIKSAHLIKDPYIYNKRFTPFGFGVDELFVNKYWIKKVVNGKIGIQSYYSPSIILWCVKNKVPNLIIDKRLFSKALEYIVGKYYKKGMSDDFIIDLIESYYYIDSRHYAGLTFLKTDQNVYFARRFQSYIDYSIKNDIYWLDINLLKVLQKCQRGIVMSMCIYEYDNKKNIVNRIMNFNAIKFI
jgi:hypothetical protein